MLCIIQRILSVDFQISQFCTRGLVDTSCTGNEYHYMANPYDQSDLVLDKSSYSWGTNQVDSNCPCVSFAFFVWGFIVPYQKFIKT